MSDGSWTAYFKNAAGEIRPVREPSDSDRDQDWLDLRFSDFEGPRIRLGVLAVINRSAASESDSGRGAIEVPVSGLQEILSASLYNTKRFDVIEQRRVAEVLSQQTRTDTSSPGHGDFIRAGRVLGAQYLGYATVNEWMPARGRRVASPSQSPRVEQEAVVTITFSLTDITTGVNVFTTTETARMPEWVAGPRSDRSEPTEHQAPVSSALRACANKGAWKIAQFLRSVRWKGTVIDIKKGEIFINAGSEQGLAESSVLSVLSVRGLVVDRESGTVLGEDLRGIGTLRVAAVQKSFSIAQIIDACMGLKIGDRVELSTPALPREVRTECRALEPDPTR